MCSGRVGASKDRKKVPVCTFLPPLVMVTLLASFTWGWSRLRLDMLRSLAKSSISEVLGGLVKPDHALSVVQAPAGRDPDRHITNLGKFQQIVGVCPTVDLDQHSFVHPFPLCCNRRGSINGFVQDGAIGSSQSFVGVQTFDNKESGKPFLLCCCGFRASREIRIVCHWEFRVSIKGISWDWGWAWGWRLILSWHAHICCWRRLAVCHQDYIYGPLRIGTKFAKKAPAMAKNKGHPATQLTNPITTAPICGKQSTKLHSSHQLLTPHRDAFLHHP